MNPHTPTRAASARSCIAFATLALAAVAGAAEAPRAAPGVTTDPCIGVPVRPTEAHEAAPDSYARWMHDWLVLDWGQRCRYRDENAALPAANPQRVVLLGDSITEGWKDQHPGFFNAQLLDRGISGQVSEQMIVRLRSDVIELGPAIVQIMAGTNDLAGNRGPTTLALIEGNLATLAELARAHGITVLLASIPPAAAFPWQRATQPSGDIRTLNAWLRGYAQREHFSYVDYYAVLEDGHGGMQAGYSGDGVHPNAAGYAVMEPLLRSAIAQALAARRRRGSGHPRARIAEQPQPAAFLARASRVP
jgi:lysophospholipase L1-like esterase